MSSNSPSKKATSPLADKNISSLLPLFSSCFDSYLSISQHLYDILRSNHDTKEIHSFILYSLQQHILIGEDLRTVLQEILRQKDKR